MSHPKEGYFLDGEKVPSVTQITNRFKDSGPLIAWANRIGLEGKKFTEVRDAAGEAGTCGHDMIEHDTHGKVFDRSRYKPEVLAKADHCFLGYLEWKENTKLEVVKSELPLVSRLHRFGGTFDAITANKKLWLLDYKTSNGVYADFLIQVAGGYGLLWQEHFPDQPLAGIQLLRVSKPEHPDDPVSFHHHFYSSEIFAICQDQFLLYLAAFTNDKRLKKLV